MTRKASDFLTQYAQQAKAIPQGPPWGEIGRPDLLWRESYGGDQLVPATGTWTTSGGHLGANYVQCNAVQGARAFTAEDLQ